MNNEVLNEKDELKCENEILKKRTEHKYYALHKPVGVESTFSENIKDNLSAVFPFSGDFIIAGRLDKASEGLLLISTDGKWVNGITRPEYKKEKEYIVVVDKLITDIFLVEMGKGVDIGICVTQTCFVEKIDERKFRIVLTEGKNKQIRRMCKTLGFSVTCLKRIRIDKFQLLDLKVFKYKEICI